MPDIVHVRMGSGMETGADRGNAKTSGVPAISIRAPYAGPDARNLHEGAIRRPDKGSRPRAVSDSGSSSEQH
ncbi:MAG: hypothetical protein ACFCUR_17115 [Rhodomicrobiaceae bacterium]